ncbi:MAG: branched-chain amino acid transaminase [Candidatus Dormibacter sp.]|uniref:branched-chain amino acid transaminase n=1 Tax=Candidatus Dormibacter sp. TaxID=2973982 RepID=UPI000DB46F0D|nr:MAG: branched chain amino acid aminotransferase [Candidatus Dormibacteraeota bacterium]
MTVEIELKSRVASRPEHPNSWVFYDGEVVRYHDAHIGIATHALHYGTACFEGIRAYWNETQEQLFLLHGPAHYDRLRNSGKILRMELPYSTEELIDITLDLLRRNDYRTDAYIRPLLYKSVEQIGVQLHGLADGFLIYTAEMGNYVEIESGIRCMVSSWRRISDSALPARAKASGGYVNSALAKSEALEAGFDEAIVLTADGHVSEGSAENLFLYKDGVWVTPPVTDDILEGITRRLVINMIRDELGVPVVERSIDRTELYTCEELLLCGTGAQISPVIEVDHRRVGNGKVGEFSQEIQALYFDAVRGETSKYRDWTIPVY